jgi:hypothetical protein
MTGVFVYQSINGDTDMHLNRRNFITSGSVAILGAAFATSACAKASSEKFEITLTDAEWRKRLTPAQYQTLRKEATGQQPFPPRKTRRDFQLRGLRAATLFVKNEI